MPKGDDLTTFIVPEVMKIRSLNLPDPQVPVQACSRNTLPSPFYCAMSWKVGGVFPDGVFEIFD